MLFQHKKKEHGFKPDLADAETDSNEMLKLTQMKPLPNFRQEAPVQQEKHSPSN